MDPIVVVALATLCSGVVGLVVTYTFKSKCNKVNCCFGLLVVDRNIEEETKEEIAELDHGIKPNTGLEIMNQVK